MRTQTLFPSAVLTILLLSNQSFSTSASPASEHPAIYKQPDGNVTPNLYLHGDERYAWLTDESGYTVVRDLDGWYVYAKMSEDGIFLESTGQRVGQVNPQSLGLEPNLMVHDNGAFQDDNEEGEEEQLRFRQRRNLAGMPSAILCEHEATSVNPCYLKQLALLVRFAGHEDRKLPESEDIDMLFNHNGPTGTTTASTGSISDVYRANSFDTFVLDSHVTDWIQISKTEEYCSAGMNGFNYPQTRECWAEALEIYANTLGENGLSIFDGDSDGYIDGMAIVHSGVAAETNGADCETGAIFSNRIWSHSVPKSSVFEFLSEFGKDVGIKVGRFYVFSGILDVCPPGGAGKQWETSRIAVGVHEGGHFLGLNDLYGKSGKDQGIGNWGFMGKQMAWCL